MTSKHTVNIDLICDRRFTGVQPNPVQSHIFWGWRAVEVSSNRSRRTCPKPPSPTSRRTRRKPPTVLANVDRHGQLDRPLLPVGAVQHFLDRAALGQSPVALVPDRQIALNSLSADN